MKRLVTAASVVALAGAGLVAAGGPAAADDRRCTGRISSRTIDGNLVVPAGATCAAS